MSEEKLFIVVSDEYREDARFWLVPALTSKEALVKVVEREQQMGGTTHTYLLADVQEVNFETGMYLF